MDSERPVPRPEPVPDPEGRDNSEAVDVSVRRAGPGVRPKYTDEDFKTVASKIRYDLTAAQAKLTELMSMLASVDLPTEAQPFSEERFLTFVRNTAHVYTDSSLEDEARIQGAPDEFISRALELAAEVRAEAA